MKAFYWLARIAGPLVVAIGFLSFAGTVTAYNNAASTPFAETPDEMLTLVIVAAEVAVMYGGHRLRKWAKQALAYSDTVEALDEVEALTND